MSEVFLAQQRGLAGFERLVVVKRIRRELNQDPQFVDLFLQEARLAAQLRHPNIVEIHDIVRQDDDYFIVMDYLAGEDLRTIASAAKAQAGPMPVEVASRIIADVAAGLAHAHDASDLEGNPLNIVHRDVSPTNVIVTYSGVARVIDFGIAQANSHHIYTQPNRLRGKLAYSSPEQLSHEPLDGQSDVFSLGVVFHELLTGRRLFRGDTPASVIKAVMEQDIPAPSSINPAVPEAVDQVVLAALERDRGVRTESARAFLESLEAALKVSGLTVGNDKVAAWAAENLRPQRERRKKFEKSIASEPAGALLAVGEATTTSLVGAHDTSGISHSGGSRSAQEQKRNTVIWWWIGGLGVAALFALAFYLGIAPSTESDEVVSGFLLHTTPDSASLYIDDRLVAERIGPGVTINARPGETVSIRIQLDGHRDHSEELIASEERRELFFNLTREAAPVRTEIAAVMQPTPTEMRSPAAPASVRTVRRTGMRTTMRVAPSPPPEVVQIPTTSTLDVRSTPSGAQVVVDGQSRGSSPVRGLTLEPGREHTIQLTLADHRAWSTRITPVPGQNPAIVAELDRIPPPTVMAPAAMDVAPTDPAPTPMRQRDITVATSVLGNASRGRSIVSTRCASCHPGGVRGGSRSASAWNRYFATGRHGRHAMLRDSFSRSDLADVKAFLVENAAGVERRSVGGVR